jgi:hypothetical protein
MYVRCIIFIFQVSPAKKKNIEKLRSPSISLNNHILNTHLPFLAFKIRNYILSHLLSYYISTFNTFNL